MIPTLLRALGALLRALLLDRDDLALENLALKQQLAVFKHDQPRPRLTRADRIFWVLLSRLWTGWRDALVIVRPETVVRWHRQGFRLYWRRKSRRRRPGRPATDLEIRLLIRRLASENPTWRAPRIHAELLKLGFDVCERTVSRYLPKRPPDPAARQRWRTFLRNHREVIAAMDLFVVPTATFRLLYGFFVIHHGRRRILHFNATEHPTENWIVQQLREAFPFDTAPRYLICDRDACFSARVRAVIQAMGIQLKRCSPRSPWQNGAAERWVLSCRRELLDHVIVLGERHLVRLVREYITYYHEDRCHLGLDKDAPVPRATEHRPSPGARVGALPRVGGLHHRYVWDKAA